MQTVPIESNGPLPSPKEPLQRGSAGELIAADAPHWRREAFIPVATEDLAVEIAKRPTLSAFAFRKVVGKITRHVARMDKIRRRRLARLYAPLDPDREVVRFDAPPIKSERIEKTRRGIAELLSLAAYTKLKADEVQACVGVSSAWGVHVLVDFEQLKNWEVYARGDVCGLRPQRKWRNMWRNQKTEVPLYQRLVVMFEVQSTARMLGEQLGEDRLHLRVFKNIPKPDVDMLLPTITPRIGWLDRSRIIVPTVGKVGLTIYKIARSLVILAFVGIYGTLAMIALVFAVIFHAVRSVFVYLQTRDRLLLSMTRSLYYQKLDSGAGVIWNLSQSALEQEIEEAMVAAAVLLEADDAVDQATLEIKGAQMVAEIAQVEVIFRAKAAAELLVRCGAAVRDETGKLRLVESARS